MSRSLLRPTPMAGDRQDSRRKSKTSIQAVEAPQPTLGTALYLPPRIVLRNRFDGPCRVQFELAHASHRGGYGSVYKVTSRRGHHLALKCPKYKCDNSIQHTLAILESVVWELEVYARLGNGNPHIVSIVDMETDNDVPLLFMPWAEHGSLQRWMRDSDRPLDTGSDREVACRLLHILLQVSGGVAYAHSRGITHADLKPGNILVMATERATLADDTAPVMLLNVKVCDFGISGSSTSPAAAEESSETDSFVESPFNMLNVSAETSTALRDSRKARAGRGTPGYASPEQAGFVKASILAASDVWSFGLLMRELLSRGTWSRRVLVKNSSTMPPDAMLHSLKVEVRDEMSWLIAAIGFENGAKVVEIIESALKKEPSQRISMGSIHSILTGVLQSCALRCEPVPVSLHASKRGIVYYWYAIWYQKIKRDDNRAEDMYRRAVAADPKDAVKLINFAYFMYTVRGNAKIAELLYERAVEVDPTNADALSHCAGFVHSVRGDVGRALALFESAVAADPGNADTLSHFASFLYSVSDDTNLIYEYFKRAVAADPMNAVTLSYYASFMHKVRRDPATAEALFKRAIVADPDNAATLGNYADFVLLVHGDTGRAGELHERAVVADPLDVVALSNCARFMWEVAENMDRANELFERAIAAGPQEAATLANFAYFLYSVRGDTERAYELIERAAMADPLNDIFRSFLDELQRLRRSLTLSCSGPCEVCNKFAEKRCANCNAVFYCCRDHQKSHWKTHRQTCRA